MRRRRSPDRASAVASWWERRRREPVHAASLAALAAAAVGAVLVADPVLATKVRVAVTSPGLYLVAAAVVGGVGTTWMLGIALGTLRWDDYARRGFRYSAALAAVAALVAVVVGTVAGLGDGPGALVAWTGVQERPGAVEATADRAPRSVWAQRLREDAGLGVAVDNPTMTASGALCTLVGGGGMSDPTSAVACTDGAAVRTGRFTEPVPSPSAWLANRVGGAGSLVPGTTARAGDAYGYLDRDGSPVLVAPLVRRVGTTGGYDVPAGAVVWDAAGHWTRVGPDAALDGPTVPRSVATDVVEAVVGRPGAPGTVRSGGPRLEWRGGQPWWVQPLGPSGPNGPVTHQVEVSGRTGPDGRPAVVLRRLDVTAPSSTAAAARAAGLLGSDVVVGPDTMWLAPGGAWLVEVGGVVVSVGADLVPCRADARCQAPAARVEPELPSLGTDELIARRDAIDAELDARLRATAPTTTSTVAPDRGR